MLNVRAGSKPPGVGSLGASARQLGGLGEKIEDRVGRDGTEVADHAGGGEPVLGG